MIKEVFMLHLMIVLIGAVPWFNPNEHRIPLWNGPPGDVGHPRAFDEFARLHPLRFVSENTNKYDKQQDLNNYDKNFNEHRQFYQDNLNQRYKSPYENKQSNEDQYKQKVTDTYSQKKSTSYQREDIINDKKYSNDYKQIELQNGTYPSITVNIWNKNFNSKDDENGIQVPPVMPAPLGQSTVIVDKQGVVGIQPNQPPMTNGTRCVYRPETQVFSCISEGLIVECNAIANFSSVGYSMFGIEKVRDQFLKAPFKKVKFYLYPRNLENLTYFNSKFELDGKLRDLVLYYDENFVDYGIRVSNANCYKKIVRLLKSIEDIHVVSITDVNVAPNDVSLITEVFIAPSDPIITPQWLGFGFPWLGLGALGWGWGLGWGLPL